LQTSVIYGTRPEISRTKYDFTSLCIIKMPTPGMSIVKWTHTK